MPAAAKTIPDLLKAMGAEIKGTAQHVVKLALNEPKQLVPLAKQNWIVFAPMVLAMISGVLFGGDFDRQCISPPNWVFPIVWPILYMQIGYAIQLIWLGSKQNIRAILPQAAAITVNLFYNYSWSPAFFGRHEIKRALRIAAGIAVSAYASAWLFYQVNPKAAVYLVPYCAWVTFAFVLNWRFLALNGPTGQAAKVGAAKKNK